MKKILLNFQFVLLGFICTIANAQISVIENFNASSSLPAGWSNLTGTGSITTSFVCTGGTGTARSIRKNQYASAQNWILGTPTGTSNGQNLTIAFDYKLINFSGTNVATPNTPNWGTIKVQVSTDGGTTWTIDAGEINTSNHTVSNSCSTVTYNVPGSSVPSGNVLRVRWNCNFPGGTPDYYVYLDNVSITQSTVLPPNCTTLSSPANGATNVNIAGILTWNAATGGPTGYKLKVGTTSGGTDIVNNLDIGLVTTYDIPGILSPNTQYFVTVTPYNANGDAVSCTETNFTTGALTPGDFCSNAIDLGTLTSPYSSTTVGALNDFSFVCNPNTDPDLIFFIDVPNGQQLTIGQTVNGYDSENYVFWGGTCPGTTQIACFDDADIQNIVWSNVTGSTQRVYWIQDGYNSGNSGTFTLAWSLSAAPTPPDCASYVAPANGATNVAPGSILLDWDAPISGGTPTGYKVFTGTVNPPTTLTSTVTAPTTQLSVSAPAFNTTYYWQVVPTNSAGDAVGCAVQSFTTEPPPSPPANDLCDNAAAGPVGVTGTLTMQTCVNAGGTAIPDTPEGITCEDAAPSDVWYTVVTDNDPIDPETLTITVTESNAAFQDMDIMLYTGTCAGLTWVASACTAANPEVLTYNSAQVQGGNDDQKAATTYYVRVNDFASAVSGTFTIAFGGSALPIALKSFTARENGSNNLIEWITATERNTQQHIVERSADGQTNWVTVGEKVAQGNSSVDVRYSLEDKNPLGLGYYRLRSVDFDGKEQLSAIAKVARKSGRFTISTAYPSPAADRVTLEYETLVEGPITLRITDLSGREVMSQQMEAQKGIQLTGFMVNDLAAGTYLIQLISNTEATAPYRIVKK
jgi:Secretion system C-terminal sorting domain